jgi:hypothetical protein
MPGMLCVIAIERSQMSKGRDIQVLKQFGEYRVAAELCRRGFVAATFSGNVPEYDIIATNERGKSFPIQVKAIRGYSWQFNATKFLNIEYKGKKQIIKRKLRLKIPDLICVFLIMDENGKDRFFIFNYKSLQRIIFKNYNDEIIIKRKGIRAVNPKSTHTMVKPKMLHRYEDNWDLITNKL